MERIGVLVKKAIYNFFKINQIFPENIILYRDGVGEGQFSAVRDREVVNILNIIKEIGTEREFDYQCKFMEVIVQKKRNERFFQETNKGLVNPMSGTVVMDQTVSTKFWDFYLVAQKVT